MIKVTRNIAKLKNLDLFYLDTRTNGPIILCLHGRCGRAETWYDFMQHYGDRYRIIAPDQRGHGLSGNPDSDYTDKAMAEDAVELLKLLDIDSALLVGHSMGGAVVGHIAAFYPEKVKAAAILDKSADGPDKASDHYLLFNPTKDWPLPFPAKKEASDFIKQVSCSELEYQYFMNSLTETVNGYEMMFRSKAMAIGIANYTNWYHLLPQITCPVLLVRSKSHEAVPDGDFARMQSLLSNCTAREMSDPDHNVHLANKPEFYGYFDEFLSSINDSI